MPIVYKLDILTALKEHGFNTTRLRREKLLSESTIQALREKKPISWDNISRVCNLLGCQPGEVLEYEPESEQQKTVPD